MSRNKCKECGCFCNKCISHDVHLHVEIENLKQRLVERDNHIVTMETTFLNEANKYPNGEFVALREELLTWQDKYSRLYEAHKRVQKVNQSLEDKLLKLVDKTETEKCTLTKDVATLSHRLADANYMIQRLQEDNEKYKNDVNLAIQLLQCKPTNFVSHRLDSFPNDMQAKVSSYVASRRKPPEEKRTPAEIKSIKVPIPTFPPTAMVYTVPKTPSPENDTNQSIDPERPQVDKVSAAIMAKILEEREKERSITRHCDSCTCSKTTYGHGLMLGVSISTQTDVESPLGSMKIVPSKIVVSEHSKISINTFSDTFVKHTPPKHTNNNNHHRLCEENETKSSGKIGPRYCSMRLQSGSNNILLDNIHGNYPPVLYTRHHPDERKTKPPGDQRSAPEESSSSDERKSLILSECDHSYHKQQRVAEWVQNIDENDASNSETSKNDLNHKQRLTEFTEPEKIRNFLLDNKEMVEKLLYKTDDEIQTKQIFNKKYQSLAQTDGSTIEYKKYQSLAQTDGSTIEYKNNHNQNNTHTETEI